MPASALSTWEYSSESDNWVSCPYQAHFFGDRQQTGIRCHCKSNQVLWKKQCLYVGEEDDLDRVVSEELVFDGMTRGRSWYP